MQHKAPPPASPCSGVSKESGEDKKYEANIEFFAEVDPADAVSGQESGVVRWPSSAVVFPSFLPAPPGTPKSLLPPSAEQQVHRASS